MNYDAFLFAVITTGILACTLAWIWIKHPCKHPRASSKKAILEIKEKLEASK